MRRLLVCISLICLGIYSSYGHSLSKIELKHPADLIYKVSEDKDGKTLTITNPHPEKPTLREIIYYHLIEKPYYGEDGEQEDPGTALDFDQSSRPFTNGQGYQFLNTDPDAPSSEDDNPASSSIDERKDMDYFPEVTTATTTEVTTLSTEAPTSKRRKREATTETPNPNITLRLISSDYMKNLFNRKRRRTEKRLPHAPVLTKLDLARIPASVEKLLTNDKSNNPKFPAISKEDDDYLSNDKVTPEADNTDGVDLTGDAGVVWDKLSKNKKYAYPVGEPLHQLEANDTKPGSGLGNKSSSSSSNKASGSKKLPKMRPNQIVNGKSKFKKHFKDLSSSEESPKRSYSTESADKESGSGSGEGSSEEDSRSVGSDSSSDGDSSSEEGSNSREGYDSGEESNSSEGSDSGEESSSGEGSDSGEDSDSNSSEDNSGSDSDEGSGSSEEDSIERNSSNEEDKDFTTKLDDILNKLHNVFIKHNSSIVITPSALAKPENANILNLLHNVFNSTKLQDSSLTPGIIVKTDPKRPGFLSVLEGFFTNIVRNKIIVNNNVSTNPDDVASNKDKDATDATTAPEPITEPPKTEKPIEHIATTDPNVPILGKHDKAVNGSEDKDKKPDHKDDVNNIHDTDKDKSVDNKKPDNIKPNKDINGNPEDPFTKPKRTHTERPSKHNECSNNAQDKQKEPMTPVAVDQKIDYMLDLMNNEKFWNFMGDLAGKYLQSLMTRTSAFIKEEISYQIKEYIDALRNLEHKIDSAAKEEAVEREKGNVDPEKQKERDDAAKDHERDENKLDKDPHVIAKNIYGNTVGNQNVTNVYIFYSNDNINDVISAIKQLANKNNSTNIFTFGSEKHEHKIDKDKDEAQSHLNDKENKPTEKSTTHTDEFNTPRVTESTPRVTENTPRVTDFTPRVTESTPRVTKYNSRVTKVTPRVNESTPRGTGFTSSVTEATPRVSDATPRVTEFTPRVSEFTPRVSEFTPRVTEPTPRATKVTHSVTESITPRATESNTPRVTESTPHVTKFTPRVTEATAHVTEFTSRGTESTPRVTEVTHSVTESNIPHITESTPHVTKFTPRVTEATGRVTEFTPRGTESTPHVTKFTPRVTESNTPRVTESTPHVTKFIPRVTEATAHVTELTPRVTESTPHVTKFTPRVTESNTPRVTESTPHVTKYTPRVSEATAHVTEFTPRGTESTPRVTESVKPRVTESTPRITEATPHVTESTPRITGFTPRVTEATPHVTESTPHVTESTPRVTESTPLVTESTPRITKSFTVSPIDNVTKHATVKMNGTTVHDFTPESIEAFLKTTTESSKVVSKPHLTSEKEPSNDNHKEDNAKTNVPTHPVNTNSSVLTDNHSKNLVKSLLPIEKTKKDEGEPRGNKSIVKPDEKKHNLSDSEKHQKEKPISIHVGVKTDKDNKTKNPSSLVKPSVFNETKDKDAVEKASKKSVITTEKTIKENEGKPKGDKSTAKPEEKKLEPSNTKEKPNIHVEIKKDKNNETQNSSLVHPIVTNGTLTGNGIKDKDAVEKSIVKPVAKKENNGKPGDKSTAKPNEKKVLSNSKDSDKNIEKTPSTDVGVNKKSAVPAKKAAKK